MVIVRLIGGLGNQLFQYAAARRLAHVIHAPLKLDISAFEKQNLRAYSLGPFHIREEFATAEEINLLKSDDPANALTGWRGRFRPHHRRSWVKERHYHFDPNILKISSSVYLEGFWQSERYFKDIEPIVRQEFTVKSQPDPENAAMAERIRKVTSASIHIRRADYVSETCNIKTHGICSLDYYSAAITQLIAEVNIAHFFVYSDDPDWARDNLKLKHPTTFVSHNGSDRGHEDLRLMSLCQHHIIANSTFSWWGAWLCSNPKKLVFAPRKWFTTRRRNAKDLIPEGWRMV